MCVCICVYIYGCIFIYLYICTLIHIQIYVYIFVNSKLFCLRSLDVFGSLGLFLRTDMVAVASPGKHETSHAVVVR